jgi:hypothetical protein
MMPRMTGLRKLHRSANPPCGGQLWADAVEKLYDDFDLVFAFRAFSLRSRHFEQPSDRFSQLIGADGTVIAQSLASFRRFWAVAASVKLVFHPA